MKYYIRTSDTPVSDFESHFKITINATLKRLLKEKRELIFTASLQPDGTYRAGWIETYDEDWALSNGYQYMVSDETPREKFKAHTPKIDGPFIFTNMKVDGGVDIKYKAWAKKAIVVYNGDGAARVVARITGDGKKKISNRFITLESFLSQ